MKRLLFSLFALLFASGVAFGQSYDFPSSPALNQQVTGPNGQFYKWDGTKWIDVAGASTAGAPLVNPAGGQNNYAPINNAALTGTLTLNGSAVGGGGAPLTNPAGGQNNYAPLASPTFTGTAALPTGSTLGGTPFGTAATVNTGTSGATIPLLNGVNNTWSQANFFPQNGVLIKGSGAGYSILASANAGATNFTATLPAATDTIAELGQTQTWTANQTFPNTGIIQRGTSTGNLTITNALAAAGSFNATFPANTGTVAELNLAQSWTAVQTFSSAPVLSGASITSATIPMAALVNSGVTAASYTNANITVNAQGLITTASNGSGGSPFTTHTLTESAGAATMAVTSSSSANTESNYMAMNANATVTTPAAAGMADMQEIYLYATTSGTAYTYTTAAGSGVTLASVVPGDSTPYGRAVACGAIPATGAAWWHWKYRSSNATLTLLECGVSPPAPGTGAVTAWTPTLTATTTNPTVTYSGTSGYYAVSGKTAWFWMHLSWSSQSGGAGTATVGGWPLTTFGGGATEITCMGFGLTHQSGYTTWAMYIGPGSSLIYLGESSTATAVSTGAVTTSPISNFSSTVGSFSCQGVVFLQ